MHFICSKKDLVQGLHIIERAIASNDTIQILTGINIEASRDEITLTASNLELTIQTKIQGNTILEGNFICDGKLPSIIRKLPDGNVTIEVKNSKVHITAENIEFAINCFNPEEEFPVVPELINPLAEIASDLLTKMIKNTVFATVNDDTRPYLSSVLFEFKKPILKLVATDANRLSLYQTDLEKIYSADVDLLVPNKNLNELLRILPNDKEVEVILYHLEEQLVFKFEQTILSTRLVNAQFPNYQAIIPSEQPINVTLVKDALENAMERAILFDKKGTLPVIFKAEKGILELQTPPSDVEQYCESIPVEHSGGDGKAAYSPKFILEMLKASDAEMVTFEFNSDLRQALLRPADHKNHLYIIMPIYIN